MTLQLQSGGKTRLAGVNREKAEKHATFSSYARAVLHRAQVRHSFTMRWSRKVLRADGGKRCNWIRWRGSTSFRFRQRDFNLFDNYFSVVLRHAFLPVLDRFIAAAVAEWRLEILGRAKTGSITNWLPLCRVTSTRCGVFSFDNGTEQLCSTRCVSRLHLQSRVCCSLTACSSSARPLGPSPRALLPRAQSICD